MAHEYFFAFAEIDYNESTRSFEITLEGSAHDVEDVLNESGIAIKELEDHYKDAEMLSRIEGFIQKGFAIYSGTSSAVLRLEGMEVQPNGLVRFYIKSDPIAVGNSLTVQFDWLMDVLPKQQNKLTLSYRNEKYTAVFLPHERKSTIQLNQ